jgi:hypothetical protein
MVDTAAGRAYPAIGPAGTAMWAIATSHQPSSGMMGAASLPTQEAPT